MVGIELRDARAEDHATFVELFSELAVDDVPPGADPFVAEMLPTTIVAEREGRIAGYAYFRPIRDVVHLSHLVTAPWARRSGVGRALFREVVARSKARGCSVITLNVKPENAAAIALYEHEGLIQGPRSHALRMAWAIVDGLPEAAAPYVDDAVDIDPRDDGRLERATNLPRGLLAEQRSRSGRLLIRIESTPGRIALTVFDRAFPGAYPFKAHDIAHALSLLAAIRPHARPEHETLNIMIEAQPELAQTLLAVGATLKMEIVNMRGSI